MKLVVDGHLSHIGHIMSHHPGPLGIISRSWNAVRKLILLLVGRSWSKAVIQTHRKAMSFSFISADFLNN